MRVWGGRGSGAEGVLGRNLGNMGRKGAWGGRENGAVGWGGREYGPKPTDRRGFPPNLNL
jgi:hypothetical protein